MVAFMLIMLGFFGYLIFTGITITRAYGKRVDPYEHSRYFLLCSICIAALLIMLSMFYSFRCYQMFGRGLLEYRQRYRLGMVDRPSSMSIMGKPHIIPPHRIDHPWHHMALY
jgi:hypothetical protein